MLSSSKRKLVSSVMWGMAYAVTAAVPSAAAAQECTKRPEALSFYQEGQRRYIEQDFDAAIKFLEAAYQACPYPVFLQAISVCHAGQGQYESAVDISSKSLALQRNRGDKIGGLSQTELVKVKAYRRAWQRRLNAERAAMEVASRPAAPSRELPQVEPDDNGVPRALGWGGVATGALLLGSAGVFSLMVANASDTASSQRGGDRAAFEAAQEDLDLYHTAGRVSLIAGSSLVALGALTLWLYPSAEPAAQISLSPAGASIVWQARF